MTVPSDDQNVKLSYQRGRKENFTLQVRNLKMLIFIKRRKLEVGGRRNNSISALNMLRSCLERVLSLKQKGDKPNTFTKIFRNVRFVKIHVLAQIINHISLFVKIHDRCDIEKD